MIRAAVAVVIFAVVMSAASAAPAPKSDPNAFPLAGEWEMQWGSSPQKCWFSRDGKYNSCRFGGGKWHASEDCGLIVIEFEESGGKYGMVIDPKTMTGRGWRASEPGSYGPARPVPVELKRIGDAERKPTE